MSIKKLIIENFKCFKGKFSLDLNSGVNIIVGDNEAGKSTILEAINLALTGIYHGSYLRNELSQYLFNKEIVAEYLASLKGTSPQPLPYIRIELYLDDTINYPISKGTNNTLGSNSYGVEFKIFFDEIYTEEYAILISRCEQIDSLPIEYYKSRWREFSSPSDAITVKQIPLKSALIDSSSARLNNGSDLYINRIVKNLLTTEENVGVAQAHRKMKDFFMNESSIKVISQNILERTAVVLTNKNISIAVELGSNNAWEKSLITLVDETPFHEIGKGEQNIIKTNLALAHHKSQEANILLVEEPENHLSHTNLNKLIKMIKDQKTDKQIIITTHNSFVANKLGLNDLILLSNKRVTSLKNISPDTLEFFEKISGYDTLRLILCKKAILVEGDSDELIVQRAYRDKYNGRLPIEDNIEVISVGTTFLRFLEIAAKLAHPVFVITDTDGNLAALEKKYADYLKEDYSGNIKICYDPVIDTGEQKDFNYNTLEPKLLKVNGFKSMSEILGKEYGTEQELLTYMKDNKTTCALKIFKYKGHVQIPQYILGAI